MRVAFIGLHYEPEPSGNAPYTAGMARMLAGEGHYVQVVTGVPHYPQWRRRDGYRRWRIEETLGGVRVKRLWHPVPRRPSLLTRAAMELFWGLRAGCALFRIRADVVVIVSPALLAAAVCRSVLVFRSRLAKVVWVQDIYGAGLSETSNVSGRLVKLVAGGERRLLGSFDKVVVAHERFLATLDLETSSTGVCVRNWAHISGSSGESLRSSLGWPAREFVCLHAGNMGVKQGLELLVEAARLSHEEGLPLRFVFMGDGNQRGAVERSARGLPNVEFIPPVDALVFPDVLAAADVLLVCEKRGVLEMSVPSKLTSYFAAGGAVVGAVASNSLTSEELRNSGAAVTCSQDPASVVEACLSLHWQPQLLNELRRNAISYASRLGAMQAKESFERVLSGVRGL